ncbi:MAG: ABC transporter substrate-binding protein [Chloroflexi bacterium]|nr:ABC transporter substrate-binding protein [Chloroflexota bacterium]
MRPRWCLLLLLVGLLAACGAPTPTPIAPSSPTPSPAAAATPAASPAPTRVPSPARGAPTPSRVPSLAGTLTLAARAEPPSLDVHREVSPVLAAFGPGIAYSRLLRFRSGPDVRLPSMEVECELCRSWEQPDPLTYLFHLREDVRWQELPPALGRKVEPKDVVASYNRQRTPGWPNGSLLQGVEGINVEGSTLRVRLKAADADFPMAFADAHSKVLPAELAAEPDLGKGPVVGSGPWVFEGWDKGEAFRFRRNPGYFEEGLPRVQALRILIIKDAATREAAFSTRLLDVDEVAGERWPEFQRGHPEAGFLLYPAAGTGIGLTLNTRVFPFWDPRVRRALLLALDPWALNRDVWKGLATVSAGVPPVAADWLLPGEELRKYLASPQEARALLREAGPASSVFLLVVGDAGDRSLRYAEEVLRGWRAVGFNPSSTVLDPARYASRVWGERAFAAALGPVPPAGMPNAYLLAMLHSRGRWSITGHADQELDRLIEAQALELDPARRRALTLQLQRRMWEDAVQLSPAGLVQVWAWWPGVRDFYPNFAGFEYAFWARVSREGP